MPSQISSSLKEAIKKNELIVFAGAGTSLSLGLPTWKALVIAIVESIQESDSVVASLKALLDAGWLSPLEVLNKLESQYKAKVMETTKKMIRLTGGEDFSRHKKILRLSNMIITTNFDKSFEFAADHHLEVVHYDSEYDVARLLAKTNYIFKLHGDADHIGNCLLFESDYKKIYQSAEEEAAIYRLRTLFVDKTLLFIGFSLSDPYIEELFTVVNRQFNGYQKTHFIITTDKAYSKSKHAAYIQPVIIDDFDEIDGLLDEMISYKNEIAGLEDKPLTTINRVPYAGLFGREEEIKIVVRKLLGNLPVVIEGFPGVGKTNLVNEVAYQCLGHANASHLNLLRIQHVVWLSDNDNPSKSRWLSILFDEIARTLGNKRITDLPEWNLKTKEAEIDKCLRGIHPNKLLIVIDNFETIQDKELLNWACNRAPTTTKVLITTSKWEDGEPANKYVLRGFLDAEGLGFIQEELDKAGISEEIPKHFLLNLLTELDSNPKLIKLAIGLVANGKLNLANIRQTLGEGMEQHIEALQKTSWSNISDDAKTILSVFQLFEGSIALSVKALFTISGLLHPAFNTAVEELGNWNLLSLSVASQRYAVHRITLRFIKNKIEPSKAMRSRWGDYYLGFVEIAAKRNKPDVSYWNALVSEEMKSIEEEWTSIIEVMQWAVNTRQDALLLSFVMWLVHYMDSRFYNRLRIEFVLYAIAACSRTNRNYEEALLRIDALGWTYVEEGKPEEAQEEIEKGLKLLTKIGHKAAIGLKALARAWQARICMEQGNLNKAEKLLEENEKSQVEAWIRTRICMVQGDIEFKKQNFADAAEFYLEARNLTRSYGGEGHDYQINPRLGFAYLGIGELEQAEERFEDLIKDTHIAIGQLYGRYGIALTTYERGKKIGNDEMKNKALQMINAVEDEMKCTTTSNLLQKMIREFRRKTMSNINGD